MVSQFYRTELPLQLTTESCSVPTGSYYLQSIDHGFPTANHKAVLAFRMKMRQNLSTGANAISPLFASCVVHALLTGCVRLRDAARPTNVSVVEEPVGGRFLTCFI